MYDQIVREQQESETGEEVMPVRALCQTAAVSRAGFYRHCHRHILRDR
jgi:hypothetical protein